MTERTPWDLGFRAHMFGKEKTDNPYPPGDDQDRWLAGWEDREEHMTARADATEETFGCRDSVDQ